VTAAVLVDCDADWLQEHGHVGQRRHLYTVNNLSNVIQLFGLFVSNRTLKLSGVSNAGLPKDYGFKNLTYTERLKRLKLPSLELRRLYNDLTWCYKILFGYVDVSSDEFVSPSPAVHTRGHPYKLFKKRSTIHSRQTFFSERVINVWNYLPYDIVCFNSLNAFKRSIVRVDFKSFYNVTSLVQFYVVY